MTERARSPQDPHWRQVAAHQGPLMRSSLWQLINTLVPYVLLWGVMAWTVSFSSWITLAVAVLAAGFLARTFIIFHDCVHGSFMRSARANHVVGFLTGVLTFTPFRQWRHNHVRHHATAGDLDARGTGDIWTMTVDEYRRASLWERLAYRCTRHPLGLFVFAPLYLFLIHHRFPWRHASRTGRREVHLTNLFLLAMVVAMSLTIGVRNYLIIQGSVILFAGMGGVWLFYVQHQFEGVYWERGPNWDFVQAAVRGSSFYRLPRVLQWFSGNIGFHHIHHLSPAIPNYRLESCHEQSALFRQVRAITFWSSLKSLSYRLWDEKRRRLVGFGHLRRIGRDETEAGGTSQA